MKNYAFLKSLKLRSNTIGIHSRMNTYHSAINPINGFDMGIPLNIVQNVFTHLHYGEDIITPKMVILQFLIGYYTYGKDRYKDALEYNENKYETSKKDLYEFLIKYKNIYDISYNITFLLISYILLFDEYGYENIPILILLLTTEYYKEIKKINPYLKPTYISLMWTFSTVILPCFLHDHNLSILESPMDYVPCMLTLFSTSTILDLKDIEEDKKNNIQTLPVKYGIEKASYLSLALLGLSSLLVGLNHNYLSNPIANSFFELQNAGLSILPIIITNSTINLI